LAPSITEVLFALDLGDRVAGVTQFCNYPPEANIKPRVGGYYDLNYEAVAALDPDLIVLLPEHTEARGHFTAQGYRILTVNHQTIESILESIRTVGRMCQAGDKAEQLIRDARQRMTVVRQKTSDVRPVRVMLAVGRDVSSGRIEDVCIAGTGGFYEEMIDLAGGENVFQGNALYPTVAGEGIVSMNPEVIIDMTGDLTGYSLDSAAVARQWDAFPEVTAVRDGRVYVLDEDYMTIPGPRFVLVIERLARALHPEVDWK
jgi:iron complex transport system substrate-binding protein